MSKKWNGLALLLKETHWQNIAGINHSLPLPLSLSPSLPLSLHPPPKVGEIRAHAAEWTANVSAEFKETRRRVSIEIYDKFQRAASIKHKLSTDLGLSPAPELSLPSARRDEREREREAALQGLMTPLARNGRFFLNGLDPEMGDISIIEHLK